MKNMLRVQVGIPTLGGSEWVAGAIYTSNLYRAIGLLPPGSQLSGVLLERAYRRSATRLSGIGSARRHYFSHVASARETMARRLAKRAVSLIRHPEATSLEEVVRKLGLNLLFPLSHNVHGLDCAQAHWIPDFQHCRHPEYFPGRSGIERREDIQRQLAEARFAVLSSTSALNDALHYHPEHAAKYRVLNFVTLPEDSWFARDPASVSQTYSGNREFLIFPSQLWAHKGHDTLLHAVALLRKRVSRDVLVLCPGFRSDFRRPHHYAELQALAYRLGVVQNVRFLGLLPRYEQVQLLRAAKAVIQPSRFEGWSSLLEDAQGLGKPAFASDLPVHREQDPPRTVYFAVDRPEALADAIATHWSSLPPGYDELAESHGRRRQLERGRDFALRFQELAAGIVHHHQLSQQSVP